MALSQSLQQKLLQKLSPQQIQLMKLLQVPTANLEERIKEELEENPALEVTEEDHEDNFEEGFEEFEGEKEDFESEGSEDEYGQIDISEYVHEGDDEVGDYRLRDDNYGDNEEQKTIPHRIEKTFHEHLLDQLGMLPLDERRHKIAEQIIGSLDDDGYLRREISPPSWTIWPSGRGWMPAKRTSKSSFPCDPVVRSPGICLPKPAGMSV